MSRNKIFISFRNKDGDVLAAHLDALLRKEYGDEHIFRSGRSIKPGAVFDRVILDALDRTLVMLVIIGPGWAGEAEGGGRRIDRPEDWVRKEVSYGLAAEGSR